MTKTQIQNAAFEMIALIAEPKHLAFKAFLDFNKTKNRQEALAKIKKAKNMLGLAHKKHFKIIQAEASGEEVPFSLILIHAEDQFMTTQTIIDFIEVAIHGND